MSKQAVWLLIFVIGFVSFFPLCGTCLSPESLLQKKLPYAEQRWVDELQELATYYNSRLKRKDHSPVKLKNDSRHFAIMREEIKESIQFAPSGKAAVILGAGSLRDIPQELFDSKKFTKIFLVDLNLEFMKEAALSMGLKQQIQEGKVVFVKGDLSMVSPELVEHLVQAVEGSSRFEEALEKLTALLKEYKTKGVKIQIPTELNNEEVGFLVSSTLVPNLGLFAKLVVERWLAKRFDLALPWGPGQDLALDNEAYLNYSTQMFELNNEINQEHNEFLSELVSIGGVVYFSTMFAKMSPKHIIKRDLFFNFVRNSAKKGESFWSQNRRIFGRNLWLWFNRPDMGMGHFVHSYMMRQNGAAPQGANWLWEEDDLSQRVSRAIEEGFRYVALSL